MANGAGANGSAKGSGDAARQDQPRAGARLSIVNPGWGDCNGGWTSDVPRLAFARPIIGPRRLANETKGIVGQANERRAYQ
jgi:hypothetical protein